MRTIYIVGILILLFFVPCFNMAAEYWPLVPGAFYHYESPTGDWLDVSYQEYYGTVRRSGEMGPYYCMFDEFYTEENGDVYLIGVVTFCKGGIDPDMINFSPPLLFLDLPLAVGNYWIWSGNQGMAVFTVTSEQEITVPAGSFSVLVVEVVGTVPHIPNIMYLNRDIGPVMWYDYELMYWEGVIPLHTATWGGVKALYW